MGRIMIALVVIAMGFALSPQPAAQPNSAAADEQRIRNLDNEWVAAVANKDVASIVRFYAEDGAVLPPGAPLAQGHEAIAKVWSGLVGLKGFALTFAPTKITIAAAGDMAYEIGTYSLSFESEKGPVRDSGKFVVVWKKVDGAWKAAADIFNSNAANP